MTRREVARVSLSGSPMSEMDVLRHQDVGGEKEVVGAAGLLENLVEEVPDCGRCEML